MATELGIFLKRAVPGLAEAKRARAGTGRDGSYPVASLADCRARFEEMLGGPIDWDE